MTLESRVEHLEEDVKRALELVRKANDRLANIMHTRNHYLRHRAPLVMKRQAVVLRSMKKLAKRLESIPRMSLQITHKARNKQTQNVILMVTSNQARKLRAIADADLRSVLNTKSNSRAGSKRAKLGYDYNPSKHARKMEAIQQRQSEKRFSKRVQSEIQP